MKLDYVGSLCYWLVLHGEKERTENIKNEEEGKKKTPDGFLLSLYKFYCATHNISLYMNKLTNSAIIMRQLKKQLIVEVVG